jgi:hypothetical protein
MLVDHFGTRISSITDDVERSCVFYSKGGAIAVFKQLLVSKVAGQVCRIFKHVQTVYYRSCRNSAKGSMHNIHNLQCLARTQECTSQIVEESRRLLKMRRSAEIDKALSLVELDCKSKSAVSRNFVSDATARSIVRPSRKRFRLSSRQFVFDGLCPLEHALNLLWWCAQFCFRYYFVCLL